MNPDDAKWKADYLDLETEAGEMEREIIRLRTVIRAAIDSLGNNNAADAFLILKSSGVR